MQSTRFLGLAAASIGLLICCASVSIQHRQVEQVKTAAIVGIAAGLNLENRNQGSGAATLGTAQEMGSLGSDAKIAERKEQGSKLYDAVAAEIGKSLGWTMKTRDEVAENAEMKTLFGAKIGTPNRLQLGGSRVYTPGILWTERVRGLEPQERKKLFEALGVDALVFVDLNYYVGKTGPVTWKAGQDGIFTVSAPVPGSSAAFPAARMTVKVYDAATPDAIWTSSAAGQPATYGIPSTMGIEYKMDLVPLLNEAAASAWASLFQSYQDDKAKAAKAAQAAPAATK